MRPAQLYLAGRADAFKADVYMADVEGEIVQGLAVQRQVRDIQAQVAVAAGAVEVRMLVFMSAPQAETLGFLAKTKPIQDFVLHQQIQNAVHRDPVDVLFGADLFQNILCAGRVRRVANGMKHLHAVLGDLESGLFEPATGRFFSHARPHVRRQRDLKPQARTYPVVATAMMDAPEVRSR